MARGDPLRTGSVTQVGEPAELKPIIERDPARP
jgi:hypothetical protein